MSNNTRKRKIAVEFTFDWEECDDVCSELMIEDAIEIKRVGVSYEILKDNMPVKKETNDH